MIGVMISTSPLLKNSKLILVYTSNSGHEMRNLIANGIIFISGMKLDSAQQTLKEEIIELYYRYELIENTINSPVTFV